MKKSPLLLITICSLCLLDGCGGSSSTPPLPVATHFFVTAPPTAFAGSSFNLGVIALDAANNEVSSYSGTVSFSSTDSRALIPANSTLAGGTGTISVTLETPGNQTITATDMSKATLTGVTDLISVSVAAATRFAVSTPSTVTAGTTFTFNVTSLDSSDQPFPGYTGTVSFTSTDGQAELPANSTLTNGTGTFSGTLKTDGSQIITATDTATASITGNSISIHVLAPASGFTPTGNMQTTREDHTATLLIDGRVLVAGGMHWAAVKPCFQGTRCFQLHALASAEIFDPATGAFTSTGEMSVARVYHTATLLGDGRVLITGGDDRGLTAYGTAEIFDPSTGVFTLTGNMVIPRSSHTATLLANGKVLLAGGSNGSATPTAELFDPATGQFTPTGNMSAARFFHTATLLSDGRVLLAGGATGTGGPTPTAELFDPATGTFTPTGSMSVARSGHRATLLKSGAVLMTGGASSDTSIMATAELFDPAKGTFAPTGSMGTARELHTATLLSNGKVLVTGGIDKAGTVPNIHYLATAEVYDPASGTFTAAGNMEIERSDHAAILLLNGEVLVTGGINGDNAEYLNSLGTSELFP
jgi:Galactose oxidase, central domain/Kelch motif